MSLTSLICRDSSGLPYPEPRRMAAVARVISRASLVAGALLALLVVTRRLMGGGESGGVARYGAFAIFFFALGGFLCVCLQRFFSAIESAPAGDPVAEPVSPRPWPQWAVWLQVALSLAIACQAAWQIDLPFDLDEYQRLIGGLTESFWHEVTPFRHTEVHSVSHFFALLSVKLFGPSRIAFRLPSLLFTALFLVALAHLSRRFLSPLAGLLVLAHLAANQMVIWYMHSMRGYISAMFVTTLLWIVLLEAVEHQPLLTREAKRDRLLLFAALFFTSVLTHPFTGIFALVLFMSLIQWAAWNSDRLGKSRLIYLSQLLSLALAILPFFAIVFVCVLRSLEPIQNVHKGGFEQFLTHVALTVPALGSRWAFLGFGLLMAAVTASRVWAKTAGRAGLLTIFVTNTVCFFGAVLWLLKVSHLEPRWFLPFLIPFVLWAADSLARSPAPARPVFLALALFFLAYIPWTTRGAILDTLGITLHVRFESFLDEVKARTSPVAENCYAFPAMNMGRWANWFHFNDQPRSIAERAQCRRHFLLSLEKGSVEAPPGAEILYSDGHGNIAYSIPPSRP